MANFRHVTKCRGGSGGDLPSFLPVRCLMLKLVHSQISKPWECHLYFAQGCHLNFALTPLCRITAIVENLTILALVGFRGDGGSWWRFGYDDGSRRSAVAGEHEGFLSSWPQRTRSTSHPCSTTRSASP